MSPSIPSAATLWRANLRTLRRSLLGTPSPTLLDSLRQLTREYALSLAAGDVQILSGRWYITHVGLLRIAHRDSCTAIEVEPVNELCSPSQCRWVFKATVRKRGSKEVFMGYGDAEPSNVSAAVHGAELRIAETRAVNRALRKAYGIGLCSVEELGASAPTPEPASERRPPRSVASNGHRVMPRVRDRLLHIVRRYELDAELVKRYAADFCGTERLRSARREMVEDFVRQLTAQAEQDRAALLAKLSTFADRQTTTVQEVAS